MIKDMIERIEELALSQPDFPVYNCLGDSFTYGDLKKDSDSIASYLESLKLVKKSPVLVFGAQTYDMLATFVALTKTGHAYIPVDVHSSSERVMDIIEISQPSLIIAIEDLDVVIDNSRIVTIEAIEKAKREQGSFKMTEAVKGDENYYIIFTSGTTGKPKGVQISHDNLLSFTNWMIDNETFNIPSKPQMLAQAPYSFDLSVMYWAPTLALGGTLYALTKELVSDFKQLFSTIASLQIGVWVSTPSFVDLAMLSDDFCQEKMTKLTHFYFDGEELTVSTAKKLMQRFPDAVIVNAYGPTEATVALSAIQITREMVEKGERLPIGHPKPDSPTYILDDNLNPLADGEIGEIIVTGPAVSKGYLNNPEKTKEAFFSYNNLPAYHTGDVGYFTSDKVLAYSGRLDFQIKYGGYRIELEDVSQQLLQSQFVEAAVAVPRYNAEHKVQNLLAFIVLKEGVRSDFNRDIDVTKAIKKSLEGKIMSYMMPSKFIYREALPMTANGKTDIKALINEVNQR